MATDGFDAMTTCESHILFLCVLETCFVTALSLTKKQLIIFYIGHGNEHKQIEGEENLQHVIIFFLYKVFFLIKR